jgi:regulator of RNase E activity RraA
MMSQRISDSEILKLKRWNTPAVYNGWEQVTSHDIRTCYNKEETVDFMPYMGPMAGRAVTVTFEPSNPKHPKEHPEAWFEYRKYIASVPGPKIVVVQDLDKPALVAAFWGEVNSGAHKALGCVGSIIDGAIRDVDEMKDVGFKAIARRLAVGHAYSTPVQWNCEVEVFGCKIQPGQLIHADQHGFLAIPPEDESGLLEAVVFLDNLECDYVIPPGRDASGKSYEEILSAYVEAQGRYKAAVEKKYNRGVKGL